MSFKTHLCALFCKSRDEEINKNIKFHHPRQQTIIVYCLCKLLEIDFYNRGCKTGKPTGKISVGI